MTAFYVLWRGPTGRTSWDGPFSAYETAEARAVARERVSPVIVHESDPELCEPVDGEQPDARDALPVIAVLLRRLGRPAFIGDADLASETATVVRFPERHGYSLSLREGGGPILEAWGDDGE